MGPGKASRILDAAEALLRDFGYRKVTVDEVARRAGIGKGTVYLYWPSKLELFGAVLTRQSAELVTKQLAVVRADPAEVRVHRAMRWAFVEIMGRPLARALHTGDYAMFGDLLTSDGNAGRFFVGKIETTGRYLAILYEHGLLADDPAADPLLPYRLSAAVTGSFLLEAAPGSADFALAQKADALATTLRRAFEPPTEPSPAALRAAADELIDLYRHWLAELTSSLPAEYSHDANLR
ncbi:TetR/AcrR family transcriptional regulator [Amycolatopsis samaneae]|uniref:TetR/AcrR family transcriptional regulator n=1 Tax=Amycolatopsis samaneae TaxID=664691 RepID=A0ABW5GQF3_9PSEU